MKRVAFSVRSAKAAEATKKSNNRTAAIYLMNVIYFNAKMAPIWCSSFNNKLGFVFMPTNSFRKYFTRINLKLHD